MHSILYRNVIVFVEPSALEMFQRQARPACESQRVDRQLHMGVLFFSCFGLVVQNVEIAVTDLQEVNVAGDGCAIEADVEIVTAVVVNIAAGEIDRNFDCHCYGVIDEHEALQRFVPLPVIWCCWEHKRRHAGGVVFLSGHCRVQRGGEFRRAVLRGLEKLIGKVAFEFGKIFCERCELPMRSIAEQELQFRFVSLVAIDLLMVKVNRAHGAFGCEQLFPHSAQS